MTMRILFVSTGGVCRAPLAAGVLRYIVDRAGLGPHFEIDCAATFPGHAGRPPTMLAMEAAARRGYSIRDIRARPLCPDDIAWFHLPLAMDRTHLSAMRFMAPGGLTQRPQMLMRFAPESGMRDVVDPFGGVEGDYERALRLIEAGCDGILRGIQRTIADKQAA
ncbi:MAG: low molecular weight phosphotyrosine protein phosphatase [Reyranella sp.]|nr:low molecular weight phosphotyrosine protein phosphatase [Reyranella sp.]